MIPAPFDYVRPGSLREALFLLEDSDEDAKLLAGGHSLIPLMRLRLATPSLLIDIGRLGELSFVRDLGEYLSIGALTRHRDIETNALVREHAPVLAAVAAQVGDPQVRHRGTIGGSISHGDPASDLPAVVLALDGILVLTSLGDAGSGGRGRLERGWSRLISSTEDSSRPPSKKTRS